MMEKDDSPLEGQEPKRKRQEKPGVPSTPSVRLSYHYQQHCKSSLWSTLKSQNIVLSNAFSPHTLTKWKYHFEIYSRACWDRERLSDLFGVGWLIVDRWWLGI